MVTSRKRGRAEVKPRNTCVLILDPGIRDSPHQNLFAESPYKAGFYYAYASYLHAKCLPRSTTPTTLYHA